MRENDQNFEAKKRLQTHRTQAPGIALVVSYRVSWKLFAPEITVRHHICRQSNLRLEGSLSITVFELPQDPIPKTSRLALDSVPNPSHIPCSPPLH